MNLKYEILNGETLASGQPLFTSANRAFRYGDGLFETIKVSEGKPHFFSDHVERLKHGMQLLHLEMALPEKDTWLHEIIEDFIKKNNQPNIKLRLIVFRDSTGFYTPATDKVSWHLSGEIISDKGYGEHLNGLTSGLFKDEFKSKTGISNVKTLNCLVSVLAGVAARNRGWNEALMMNTNGAIIESSSSNLFIRKGNSFFTPPLSDGCLDGVMRKNVIKLLMHNGVDFAEKSLGESDVYNADEILLTNAIAGVRWIENYEGKRYENMYSAKINDWLNEMTKLS